MTPEERAKYELTIYHGQFYQHGVLFDSGWKKSHKKRGFVAYTLNVQGEISVFEHTEKEGDLTHASTNAGAPVVAAGELSIEKGMLKAITTHSGHYRPTLFNVYRMLQHLSSKGVDITQAQVISFKPFPGELGKKSKRQFNFSLNQYMYVTSATELIKESDLMLEQGVHVFNSYSKGGKLSNFYKIFNKELTQGRVQLAKVFMSEYHQILDNKTSDSESKLKSLITCVNDFEAKNVELSKQHNKSQDSGRLHTHFKELKTRLHSIYQNKESRIDFDSLKLRQ